MRKREVTRLHSLPKMFFDILAEAIEKKNTSLAQKISFRNKLLRLGEYMIQQTSKLKIRVLQDLQVDAMKEINKVIKILEEEIEKTKK